MSYISPFTGDVIQPTDVSYRAIALDASVELAWPINGNASGDYAARIMDVTPTTGGLTLTMPPANQTSVGTDALIQNLGAFSFDVLDNTGGSVVTVDAGQSQYIYVTNNSTLAGVWSDIAFGSITSAANAAALAGYGLVALSSKLNQSHPFKSLSTGGTFDSTDRAQMAVWSGGAGSYTLPAASALGDNWFTLLKNNGSGSFVVSCSGADTIDGNSTKTFAPTESAFIVCTGTQYVTVGYGTSSQFVFSSFVKSVTAGSYTLSASEASNTIQEYVGSLTGNVTAVYPPVVNLYVISNQTTDNGYSLTITTGIGYDAVIPPGQQATLICDGTNFFNANTVQAGATAVSLVDGTVGTPSLNFAAETSTGVYRPGTGEFAVAVLGSDALILDSTGATIPNGISGGLFT
jgi:hypothetical protein